jgi:oxalate decarboxylase
MTVMTIGNKPRTMDFQEGDVGYIRKTRLDYIENTGDTAIGNFLSFVR